MKICVVSTWLPYWDGLALCSVKLYREISKYVQVESVANKVKDHNLPQKTEAEKFKHEHGVSYTFNRPR